MAEKFTRIQTIAAIKDFLAYGEREFEKSQQGYFSGDGWAARCLRAHLEWLEGKATCGCEVYQVCWICKKEN